MALAEQAVHGVGRPVPSTWGYFVLRVKPFIWYMDPIMFIGSSPSGVGQYLWAETDVAGHIPFGCKLKNGLSTLLVRKLFGTLQVRTLQVRNIKSERVRKLWDPSGPDSSHWDPSGPDPSGPKLKSWRSRRRLCPNLFWVVLSWPKNWYWTLPDLEK